MVVPWVLTKMTGTVWASRQTNTIIRDCSFMSPNYTIPGGTSGCVNGGDTCVEVKTAAPPIRGCSAMVQIPGSEPADKQTQL